MIVGIGIDILSIERFEYLLLRRGASKIAKRICTQREYEEYEAIRSWIRVGAARKSDVQSIKSPTNSASSSSSLSSSSSSPSSDISSGPPSFAGAERVGMGMGMEPDEIFQKQVRYLSCRWALKEAAYKSLSPTLHALAVSASSNSPDAAEANAIVPKAPKLNWKDLDIIKHPSGGLVLRPTNPMYDAKYGLLASLSHDAGVVVGVVIAQLKP
ncbi:hypothetical protein I316_06121 [Kwoniella heveanensis BCC8398]|uniref:Uncharacterized protein n=1 Tax=Kwoniella heveanensis BCC8398 TaxID=1296120 RepID=A0A1B9GMI0_9TREE|nr:hypothetical protein I316_06121 [Kwoniella heveanensis BCC8398]